MTRLVFSHGQTPGIGSALLELSHGTASLKDARCQRQEEMQLGVGKFLPQESCLRNYNSKNRRWHYVLKKNPSCKSHETRCWEF